jgi:hypothetical protein
LLGDDFDLPRRFLVGRDKRQFCALAIADEAHASEGRHRARAGERVDRNAAHLREVQSIATPQARRKGGRGRFIRKGPLHVGDDAVIVGVKAERSERLIPAIEIGNDHRQPPERERHKENATCAASLVLHAAVHPVVCRWKSTFWFDIERESLNAAQRFGRFRGISGHRADTANRSLRTHREH